LIVGNLGDIESENRGGHGVGLDKIYPYTEKKYKNQMETYPEY